MAHRATPGFPSGTTLATPAPTRLEPFPLGNRPPVANQPSKAVDSLGSEEIEIPESPGTVRVSPAASVERRRNEGDSSEGPAATAAVTKVVPAHTEDDIGVEDQKEGQEQEWEEPDRSGGDLPPSRQLILRFLRLPSWSWSMTGSLKVKAQRPGRSVVHGRRSRAELCRHQGISHILKVDMRQR